MNIVDQQTFRDAMSCIGAAVNIITTDGPAGRAGFTASAVCSVTDTPPTLLVCLNRGASVWPEHRFAAARWQTGVTGCPQLEEALVSFDCRISQVVSVGTHDILFCAIEAIHRHATPYGLVWFDRSYHALMRPAC
ncbi:flavin reductase [Escherichia coli]|nr:flavin reductase [Escherichia coli]